MLDDDACDGCERLGLTKHAAGEVRLEPHALPLTAAERTALVPDRVRDPEPAKAVDETGVTQQQLGHSHPGRGLGGEISDRARMTEEVGGLQIDEIGDRGERLNQTLAVEHLRERGLRSDHDIPDRNVFEVCEDLAPTRDQVEQRWIELSVAKLARELVDPGKPTDA